MPESIPVLTKEEIGLLGQGTINGAVAELWNRFFDTPISGWDLDFSVGRNWLRLHPIARKETFAEGWHNPEEKMEYFLRFLSERRNAPWAIWAETAAKISVLGASLGKMQAQGALSREEKAVIACISGDFSGILAGLYLKRMGFPVGKLVCCCNENNGVWELIRLGTLRTDALSVATQTPRADTVLPEGLEHVLWLLGGKRAAMEYAKACYLGGSYCPPEDLLKMLQQEIYVSVVSDNRMTFTAAGIYQTTRCLVSPYDALCYAGVQDYRAKGGENRMCLVLSQWSPALDSETLAGALGITEKEINRLLGR